MPRTTSIEINRAPVLTLWAAVVAERLGYRRDEALTLGKAVAGLNANTKAKALGLYGRAEGPKAARARTRLEAGEIDTIELLHRAVPVEHTGGGIRAANKGRVITPESVRTYLDKKFGEGLKPAREAMTELARSIRPSDLADSAFELYEEFRPKIPRGAKGWGAKGELDLKQIRSMARG